MRWSELQDEKCSVARTLSVIGDRWTMIILRDAFLGVRRFDQFCERLDIARPRLAERLYKLVDEGVLAKVEYQTAPKRYEYRLTEKGVDLYPILMMMVRWGNKWMDDGNGPPVRHWHEDCGARFDPEMVCSECHGDVDPRHVRVEFRDSTTTGPEF